LDEIRIGSHLESPDGCAKQPFSIERGPDLEAVRFARDDRRDDRPDRRTPGPLGSIMGQIEDHPKRFALLALVAGLAAGAALPLAPAAEWLLSLLVGAYSTIAPVVIFLILAPALAKLLRSEGSVAPIVAMRTVAFFVTLRIWACLLAIVCVALAFGLPLVEPGTSTHAAAVSTSLYDLGRIGLQSRWFAALAASIAVALVIHRSQHAAVRAFVRIPDLVEEAGAWITRATPLFLFLIGIYVSSLPEAITGYIAHASTPLAPVRLLGASIVTSTNRGFLATYVALSLLTGVVCTLWHALLVAAARARVEGLSLRKYIGRYVSQVYPLAWSTCSESLATPVNLHAMRRNFPWVETAFRQFATGLSTNININGTIICAFIMIAAVAQMTGVPISAASLLMCAPVIFLIGFGVPGMPGELLLFAGPIAAVLGVPPQQQDAFILLYVTLQLGLPDSFRSGANVTDSAPAILLIHRRLQRSGGLDAEHDGTT
jgi:Na+/H+-dicarboxylate symporter